MIPALLVGVGNPHRGDDGVGVAVARRAAAVAPAGVQVVVWAEPAALLELWDGAGRVVVVDAMRSGQPPGSIATLEVTTTPLPAGGWAGIGTHGFGVAAAVELARTLGRLPQRLVVVGVEAGPVAVGDALSAPVAAAVEAAVTAALSALATPVPGP